MFGRYGFAIHGDEIANVGKRLASQGCIVMGNVERVAIWTAAHADGCKLQVIV
jgi:hypothetical protein